MKKYTLIVQRLINICKENSMPYQPMKQLLAVAKPVSQINYIFILGYYSYIKKICNRNLCKLHAARYKFCLDPLSI